MGDYPEVCETDATIRTCENARRKATHPFRDGTAETRVYTCERCGGLLVTRFDYPTLGDFE